MKLLLDTHTLLWQVSDDPRLSATARAALLDPVNALSLSAASLWEIAIKVSLGKLDLAENWPATIDQELKINQIRVLPIESSHCAEVASLPFHHRDPFDRMLVAQARVEGCSILGKDRYFRHYPVECLW